MADVHVRIGEYRKSYHTDSACPHLNGMQKTYGGQETMPEARAQEMGLTACRSCKR